MVLVSMGLPLQTVSKVCLGIIRIRVVELGDLSREQFETNPGHCLSLN